MNEYQGVRRIKTDDGATFIPVCETCGQFVKPDEELVFNGEGQPHGANADCKKCGRVDMIFEGYY